MELITYLTPIAAFIGVSLSIISVWYTYHQNKRNLSVNLDYDISIYRINDEPCDIKVKLSAFNSRFRSIAITNYEFLVNDEIINFSFEDFYQTQENDFDFICPEGHHKLPHVLKEGHITYATISVGELAQSLLNRRFKGIVTLSGFYETAEKKRFWSKNERKKYLSNSLKFNIDEWKSC